MAMIAGTATDSRPGPRIRMTPWWAGAALSQAGSSSRAASYRSLSARGDGCKRGPPSGRSDRAVERVAGVGIARFESREEPVLALLGGAVGPRLGIDLALGLLLDSVVADGRSRAQRLIDLILRWLLQ